MGEVDKLRLALESFCTTRTDDLSTDNIPGSDTTPDNIPDELEKILEQIAQSGELPWQLQWKQISYVVRRKILFCIHQMNSAKKYTGAHEEYTETMDMILSQVDMFDEAPFTIQRVCELLIEPGKHYTSTDKYMRALLKNLLVVSGWRKQPESDLPEEDTKIEKEEPKIEPDSTSEGVSFGTASSPPRRREDSPDPDCDSTNQQPDSTTTDSSKEDTNAEDKADEAESIQTVENPSDVTPTESDEPDFKERPKKRKSEDDEMDVFETMKKTSPKRKVAISNTKIQIQVGVGKGIPSSEEAEPVSSTSAAKMEDDPTVDESPPAEPSEPKTDLQIQSSSEPTPEPTIVPISTSEAAAPSAAPLSPNSAISEAPSTDIAETAPPSQGVSDQERKRKRSSDSPEESGSPTSTDPAAKDSVSTPQKLQKTE